MTKPDPLSDLPIELFELIAEHVTTGSKEDLTSLRQAGSSCAAKVWRLYRECRFSKVTVQLSHPSSIRKATDIINSRLLGPTVRKLILEDDSELHPSKRYWDDDSVPFSDDSEDDDSDSELASYEAQETVRRNGDDRLALMKLFGKFGPNGKKSRHISIIFQSLREEYEEMEMDDHCLTIVMLAIASCSGNFAAFSMNVAEGQGIPIHQYGLDYQKGIICKAALSRFQNLDLVLNADDEDDNETNSNPFARRFLVMLAKLRIRSLEVERLRTYMDKPSISVLLSMKFLYLEVMELVSVFVEWDEITLFLERHKALRELVAHPMDVCFLNQPSHIHTWQQTTDELSRFGVSVLACRPFIHSDIEK